MSRDFTYIDDLVEGMRLLIDATPTFGNRPNAIEYAEDSISKVAPFRVVNIGNSKPLNCRILSPLLKRLLIQTATIFDADVDIPQLGQIQLFRNVNGYVPNTDLAIGVRNFVGWYREYYDV